MSYFFVREKKSKQGGELWEKRRKARNRRNYSYYYNYARLVLLIIFAC